MTEYGYAGEILKIDLSKGSTSRLPTADYADRFIGGRGLAAKLYWDMVPADATAYDPENCLIYANGPLAGFPGFAGSRWVICGKAVTGDREAFCYGNLGGGWGTHLKYAGYDAIVVQGKSDKPGYLYIDEGDVEVRDAYHLWGKTSFEAEDALIAELGKGASILTIGPAAENLVSFATIIADEGASASGGLGAVMGSKMLKAIAVAGNKKPAAANPERLQKLAGYMRGINKKPPISLWGLPGITRKYACHGCGIGCDRHRYTGEDGKRYKHFCQATDYYATHATKYYGQWNEVFLQAIRLCDGYGLDTSVMKGLIAWLAVCHQEGILSEKDTDLPLSKVGSNEFIEELTRKITFREGFGDVLAGGTVKAAESIGPEAARILGEFVATRSSETKDYDPRLIITTALLYATESRRPIQQLHDAVVPVIWWMGLAGESGQMPIHSEYLRDVAVKFWGGEPAADFSSVEGKALAAKKIQDRAYVKESLVLCDLRWPLNLVYYPGGYTGEPELESRIYSAVTGREVDEAGLNRMGERIFNLQRAILLRQGWQGREDDSLLDYFFTQPLHENEVDFSPECLIPGRDGEAISKKGAVVDREEFEKIKSEYYELRGWDVASGLPTAAKLEELEMNDVALDLEIKGLLK